MMPSTSFRIVSKPTPILFVVFLAVVFASVACGDARCADRYQYIVDATNRISQLNSGAKAPSSQDLEKVSKEACQALTQLLADQNFKQDLEKMIGADTKNREERTKFRKDLKEFAKSFLVPEEEALKRAGLNEEAVRQTLWSANLLQRALDDKYYPNRITTALKRFRDDVCQDVSGLDSAARRTLTQKWAFRMTGIVLIVLDLAAAPPTAAATVGSVAIGTAVASWSE